MQVWMLSVVFSSFCCCQVNISELGLVTQSGKVVWGKSARVHRSPWSYPHPVSLPQGSTHRSQTTLRMMVVSMQSCLYEHTTHTPHTHTTHTPTHTTHTPTHTHHIACIISNFMELLSDNQVITSGCDSDRRVTRTHTHACTHTHTHTHTT